MPQSVHRQAIAMMCVEKHRIGAMLSSFVLPSEIGDAKVTSVKWSPDEHFVTVSLERSAAAMGYVYETHVNALLQT